MELSRLQLFLDEQRKELQSLKSGQQALRQELEDLRRVLYSAGVLKSCTALTLAKTTPESRRESHVAERLVVSITQANGLKHLPGFSADSAAVVVCKVKPREPGEGAGPSLQTRPVVSRTGDPVWNEISELEPWHAGEALEFTVCEQGLSGRAFHGTAVLQSERFYPQGFSGDLVISGRPQAVLRVAVRPAGLANRKGPLALSGGAGRGVGWPMDTSPPRLRGQEDATGIARVQPHEEPVVPPATRTAVGSASSTINRSRSVGSLTSAVPRRGDSIGPSQASYTDFLFDRLDVNHDGVISREEFRKSLHSGAVPWAASDSLLGSGPARRGAVAAAPAAGSPAAREHAPQPRSVEFSCSAAGHRDHDLELDTGDVRRQVPSRASVSRLSGATRDVMGMASVSASH